MPSQRQSSAIDCSPRGPSKDDTDTFLRLGNACASPRWMPLTISWDDRALELDFCLTGADAGHEMGQKHAQKHRAPTHRTASLS